MADRFPGPVKVDTTTADPTESDVDTIAIGVFAGEEVSPELAGGAVRRLLDSGEARASFKRVAHTHAGGDRWIVVGLGEREEFDRERARVAAALALNRARELGAKALCWAIPAGADAGATTTAVAEGSVLGAYRFDRYRKAADDEEPGLDRVVLASPDDIAGAVQDAVVVAEAQNAARDLQNTPANDLGPAELADRALALDREIEGLTVDVDGPDALASRGMGAFLAVAQGSEREPRLITLRYEGPDASGPLLAWVGKAITFDTGGISIKPSAKMHEMKFDMSGGAAVLEAVGAVARLGLPVRLLGVIGSAENMPSGSATRPGDIVTASNGTTIEVNNTDAEGRLVLADCLCWAVEQGAERIVDIATLTGAIVIALGSTHAGLVSNDDDWAAAVEAAGRETGELLWRLPLHPEYAELIKGRFADIVNATEARKASSITAAEFLRRFVGDTPWAHIDIAGTGWDLGRPYAQRGGAGFGVRLLVELARSGARA